MLHFPNASVFGRRKSLATTHSQAHARTRLGGYGISLQLILAARTVLVEEVRSNSGVALVEPTLTIPVSSAPRATCSLSSGLIFHSFLRPPPMRHRNRSVFKIVASLSQSRPPHAAHPPPPEEIPRPSRTAETIAWADVKCPRRELQSVKRRPKLNRE